MKLLNSTSVILNLANLFVLWIPPVPEVPDEVRLRLLVEDLAETADIRIVGGSGVVVVVAPSVQRL